MKIVERAPNYFTIIHAGKEVDTPPFATEGEAYRWADANIDDQVFDSPNVLCDPLAYRTLQ
jgi:hypothetical protein